MVKVWVVDSGAVEAASLERWSRWLDPEERRKHERFATDRLKREYLLTRALSRWALSRRAGGVHPSAWRFERTEAGRPFVAGPVPAPDFNLSNTDGLVVCAVSARRVGIDVESLQRGPDLLESRTKIFSERENAALDDLTAEERASRAVELWSLKEAYLKARGDGISMRLSRLDLAPRPRRRAAIGERPFRLHALGGEVGEADPDRWLLAATPHETAACRFILGIAVDRGGAGARVSIEVQAGLADATFDGAP